MIDDAVRDLVIAHYNDGGELLLLSDLGAELRDASLWPIENEKRPLATFLDEIDGISVVRGQTGSGYVLVVPEGRREEAEQAVRRHGELQWLRGIARPALVAFCLDVPDNAHVFLHLDPPIRYILDGAPEPGDLPIEPQFRMPGLLIQNVAGLSDSERDELARKIRAWCQAHDVIPTDLMRTGGRAKPQPMAASAPQATNALERLLAAQLPDVAARLTVPIDIALALSRMP